MKKRILFAAVLALAAVLILAIPVSATQPYEVSGKMEWAGPPTNMSLREAGNNCFIEADLPYRFFDGNLEGIAGFHFNIVVHGVTCAASGPNQGHIGTLQARGTFEGSVDGKEGTLELLFTMQEYSGDPGDLGLSGTVVILSGTGELANLHGVLEVTNFIGDTFDTYSGGIHFDP